MTESTSVRQHGDLAGQAPAAPRPAEVAIADPGPLGLAAFALTTFVLSTFNAGILDTALEPVVLPLAVLYGGLTQLLAGMWEFRKNNTFGALAFSSYGAFWLSFAGYVLFIVPDLPEDSRHLATGVYLLAWTIFTLYMLIGTLRLNGLLVGVFTALSATFVLLTIGAFAQLPAVTHLGGYVGLLTALLAWYGSFAGVMNATAGRVVVPVWPRGK